MGMSRYVPINVEYPGGYFNDTRSRVWMADNDASLTMDVESHPYIINVRQSGYYRSEMKKGV